MRQPLAAIALAAHNGEALLLMGRPEQALGKFDHIRRHVLRCEERIQNGVAWLSSDVPGAAVVVRFASAVHAALTPARQWMAEANVALVVSGDLPAGAVRALPGSLEMLLGFVLRQAAEAVSRGPAPKIVEVMLDEDSSTLRVTVRHSGTPDDGEAACDGIALAMAQRLVGQTCGEVVVPGPAACRTGMAATLFFLRCDGDATRSPDQFAFASSLR